MVRTSISRSRNAGRNAKPRNAGTDRPRDQDDRGDGLHGSADAGRDADDRRTHQDGWAGVRGGARGGRGDRGTTVGLIGNDGGVDGSRVEAWRGVAEIIHVSKPYKQVSPGI